MESRACDRVSPKASMGGVADSCHGLTLLAPHAQWSCNRFVSLLPDIKNNFGMKELFFKGNFLNRLFKIMELVLIALFFSYLHKSKKSKHLVRYHKCQNKESRFY